jgi:hypothetical protein
METETLFTAFAIAETRNARLQPAPVRLEPVPADDTTLLSALRNSATDRDQIIQRRIGLFPDTANQT